MAGATAATYISMAIAAAGAVQQGMAAAKQASIAASQAENQAKQAELEASQLELDVQLAGLEGRRQEVQARKSADQVSAANLVAFGGDAFSSGSFLALRDENDEELDRTLSSIGLNTASRVGAGRTSISSALTDASNFRLSAKAQLSAGRSARTSGFINALGVGVKGGIRINQLSKTTPKLKSDFSVPIARPR